MKTGLALPTALFLLVGLAGCKPAPPTPATAKDPTWDIDGQQLESADLNLRITAPAAWTWEEDTAARLASDQRYVFVAKADNRTFFRVLLRGRGLYENSERSIHEFLDGIPVGAAKSGATVTNLASTPRHSKAGEGYAYSYEMQMPQGGTALADGYVIASDRIYNLQYISADRSQLAAFNEFIDSLDVTPGK